MIDPEERLAAAVSRELNADLSSLRSEVRLREDLGMDSIVALNLLFALERDLGIRVREEDIVQVKTVGDLRDLLSVLSGQLLR
jgi:acyl carrier protein